MNLIFFIIKYLKWVSLNDKNLTNAHYHVGHNREIMSTKSLNYLILHLKKASKYFSHDSLNNAFH